MIRRARPLLGTVVAISAEAPMAALDAAFATIERIHWLMSAQSGDSDVARINRDGHQQAVAVNPWTLEVLREALRISEMTGGAFDVVVPGRGARHVDVVLEASHVRLRRRADIDLSGIAKGFAVDLAVEALLANGASAGSVNAGGDLRFFGDWPGGVRVRVPNDPRRAVTLPALRHDAFATSCGYFGSVLHDGRSGKSEPLEWSITVGAASCLIADALTKVVALLGPARELLAAFDACAFAVAPSGELHAPAG
jgi:thiamine biosynthesis lipoprotein